MRGGIPVELPADSYQIAVLAELLTPDKQRVLASAVTPVRALPVKLPVAVKFAVPTLEAKLDAKTGATVEVKGTVERLSGATGDVAVTLTGLPAGVPVPADEIGGRYCADFHVGPIVPERVTITGVSDAVRGYALDPNTAEALWK